MCVRRRGGLALRLRLRSRSELTGSRIWLPPLNVVVGPLLCLSGGRVGCGSCGWCRPSRRRHRKGRGSIWIPDRRYICRLSSRVLYSCIRVRESAGCHHVCHTVSLGDRRSYRRWPSCTRKHRVVICPGTNWIWVCPHTGLVGDVSGCL
jgi:hypothetical protein